MSMQKYTQDEAAVKELARLDGRILSRLNNLRRLRSVYKKMRHRSVTRLAKLYRSRQRVQMRVQEALDAEIALKEQIRGPIVASWTILPTEILAEIFCLVDNRAYDSLDVRRSAPWVIGRICRQWRAISHATTKLWSNVSVDNADEREWTTGRLCLLREMLARSGSHPLQVAYTAAWDEYPVLLSELAPHTNRLSSLELTVQCHQFLNPLIFYDFADSQLLLLESFTLNVEGSCQARGPFDSQTMITVCPENASECLLFRHAPRLKRLDIQGITLSHFPLPWSQIREYRGDIILLDDLAILRKATHLQQAHIVRYQTPDVFSGQSTHLPSLRQLTLYTDDYPCRHTELYCPNLKTLRFARVRPMSSNMCIGLDAFVSATQLQTLMLDVGVHPFSTIHPIIQACSSRLLVLSLEVDDSMAADLYTQLVDDGGFTCLAPHLERLYILDSTSQISRVWSEISHDYDLYPKSYADVPRVSAFMQSVLVDMVASRVREGGCLRELVLRAPAGAYQPAEKAQEVLQKLGSLKAANGFECTVHWGYQSTLLDHGAFF